VQRDVAASKIFGTKKGFLDNENALRLVRSKDGYQRANSFELFNIFLNNDINKVNVSHTAEK